MKGRIDPVQGSEIHHGYVAECQQMTNEAVNPRANVDVLDRGSLANSACRPEVLIAYRIAGYQVSVGTVVLIALLLISGSQFTLFAMWFDMESNKDLR